MVDSENKRVSPVKLEFEERKRISFHIAGVRGLPPSGWQPVASTFVQLESLETRESFATEYKKSSASIVWEENLPIIDLKDSSKIRLEVRSHMLWNKTVLGRSETYTVSDLLKMQKEAGEERDSYVELVIKPITPIYHPLQSPPSPTSPKQHRRALSSPVGFKLPSSPTRLRMSLTPSKSPTFPEFSITTLSLSIRETAAKDRNHTLTAADFQRFVERCQGEALVELREIAEKVTGVRKLYQLDGSMFVSLLDIMLGVVDGLRKAIANFAAIRNINKNTVACLKALNGALGPYQNLSARQLEKTSEGAATLMREMLCSAVKALESVGIFLSMENAYERDKFEFKITAWLRYFEECERFILGIDPTKPDPLLNKKSRRVRCPALMVANQDLPKLNALSMTLPKVYGTYSESHSTLMRLIGEWIYSPTFRHSNFPLSDGHYFKPRENNIMCITGAAGSGKTQLAARISHWLAEMGSLGGYFTFDHRSMPFPSKGESSPSLASLLDALPLTLVHQAATVEAGLTTFISDAFAKNIGAAQHTLDKRFETLFVFPLHAFIASRLPTGGAWNPLPPLVFMIDGLVQAQTGVVEAFAEWMAGKGIRALPPHVKFLILSRPEVGLEKALRERSAACVYEETESDVRWVDSHSESGRTENGAVGLDGKSPARIPSPSFKVLIESF